MFLQVIEKILSSYSILIDKIREYEKRHPKEEAVRLAVNYCIKKGILEDYLKKHSVEVVSMSVLRYDVKTAISAARKIAMEEGKKEGKDEGQNYVLKLMEQGLSCDEIKKKLEKTSKKNRK